MQWQDTWQQSWQALGASGTGLEVRQSLLDAYAEPQRYYHTLTHLAECLGWFEQLRDHAQAPAEVAMALWFHDAIYDVKASDNEARSADWAQSVLQQAGVGAAQREHINALILATCHASVPQTPDQALLVDIDLAILGASPARFASYETQVRAEYAWVPEEIFRHKRGELLQTFLARPRLYISDVMHDQLEAPARRNLAQSLAALQAPA